MYLVFGEAFLAHSKRGCPETGTGSCDSSLLEGHLLPLQSTGKVRRHAAMGCGFFCKLSRVPLAVSLMHSAHQVGTTQQRSWLKGPGRKSTTTISIRSWLWVWGHGWHFSNPWLVCKQFQPLFQPLPSLYLSVKMLTSNKIKKTKMFFLCLYP